MSRIFALNIKLDNVGGLESFRFRQFSDDLDEQAAGTYYKALGGWCYPKTMKRADLSAPPADFSNAMADVQQWLNFPHIMVFGSYNKGISLFADDVVFSMNVEKASAIYADDPYLTPER